VRKTWAVCCPVQTANIEGGYAMLQFFPFAGRSKGRSWFWWGINIGIGLAITAAALQAAGILTFGQLARLQPEEVKNLLTPAGIRSGSPDTWPQQAALAAAAQWDELAALQTTLAGGRRIA